MNSKENVKGTEIRTGTEMSTGNEFGTGTEIGIRTRTDNGARNGTLWKNNSIKRFLMLNKLIYTDL